LLSDVVSGVEVILSMPDNSFKWQGATYHIGPASLQMDQRKIRHCKVCRGCRQQLKPMPKGALDACDQHNTRMLQVLKNGVGAWHVLHEPLAWRRFWRLHGLQLETVRIQTP
jgi:hypothetical protein